MAVIMSVALMRVTVFVAVIVMRVSVPVIIVVVMVIVRVVLGPRAVLGPAVLVVVSHTSSARARRTRMHARAQKNSLAYLGRARKTAGQVRPGARGHSMVKVTRLGDVSWPVKKLPNDELVTTMRRGLARTSSDAGPSRGLPWARVSLLPSGPARPMRLP